MRMRKRFAVLLLVATLAGATPPGIGCGFKALNRPSPPRVTIELFK